MHNAYLITALVLAVLGLIGCGGREAVKYQAADIDVVIAEAEKLGFNGIPLQAGIMYHIAVDDSGMRYAAADGHDVLLRMVDYATTTIAGKHFALDPKASDRIVLTGDTEHGVTFTISIDGGHMSRGPTQIVPAMNGKNSSNTPDQAVGMYVGVSLAHRLMEIRNAGAGK